MLCVVFSVVDAEIGYVVLAVSAYSVYVAHVACCYGTFAVSDVLLICLLLLSLFQCGAVVVAASICGGSLWYCCSVAVADDIIHTAFSIAAVALAVDIGTLLLPSLLWLMHMLPNGNSIAVVVLPLLAWLLLFCRCPRCCSCSCYLQSFPLF
jgi:hypothetical protein